jgi:RNA polymerase sigma-70 factor (ECF subfamily)
MRRSLASASTQASGAMTARIAASMGTPEVDFLDPEMFGAFYDEALASIYCYFLRRCGGAVDVAQELTQTALATAVQQITQRRVTSLSLVWVEEIARGVLLDHYQASFKPQHRRRWRRAAGDERGDRDDFTRVVDPQLAVKALNELPDAERIVVALRYLDDLRIPAIASAIGENVQTVEFLLQRGRAAFEQVYLEDGDGRTRSNVGSAGADRSAGTARSPLYRNTPATAA